MAMKALTTTQQAQLAYSPHPLLVESGRVFEAINLLPGDTLAHFLRRSPVDTTLPLLVQIDGRRVAREHWAGTPLAPGSIVTVRTLLQGGDGSNPLQAALTIGLLLSLGPLGTSLAGTLNVSVTVARALITVGGMYLISQVNKPPSLPQDPGAQISPTYGLSGSNNRARPGQPLPLVIGTHRLFPDLGAKPFTYHLGHEQYLHQVFNAGLSDMLLTDPKIGDTPLSDFVNVELEDAPGGTLTKWPGNVDTTAGPDMVYDTWHQLTSSPDTFTLVVDLSGLLFRISETGPRQVRVRIDMQYCPTGTGTWVNFDYMATSTNLWLGNLDEPWRISRRQRVTLGQYDVRVKFSAIEAVQRVTAGGVQTTVIEPIDINDSRVTARLNFTALKSYQPDTADYSGQHRLGLDVMASGQLNGVIDAFNVIASARCEVWNGSAWITGATSNPAWWFRWLAIGATDAAGRRLFGGGYSDAELDLDRLKAWGAWCDTKGLAVNLVFDLAQNVHDQLAIIARCGRASLSWGAGKLGVVYDEANRPPVTLYGMSNIIAGSFRIDYISGQLPDEIVLNWINPAIGYKPDQVRQALPGVVNPVNPVEVTLAGITNEAQAGKECNLLAAEQVYRTRTITWRTDLEGFAAARGDVVALSHDLTQWAYSGRLLAGSTTVLTLDRKVPFTDGQTHYIALRHPDGTFSTHQVQALTGEQSVITLTAPLALAPDADPDNKPLDYVFAFEPKATPGKLVKITNIRPIDQHTLEIQATDEEDDYYLAENDAYTYVPAPTPGALPSISNLRAQVRLINTGSGYASAISLAWDHAGEYGGAVIRAGFDDMDQRYAGRTLDDHFVIEGPERAKLDATVTVFDQAGRYGGANASATISVVYAGREDPPLDPSALTITELADGTRQLLPSVAEIPVDFAGFLFRARSGTHATWDALSVANGGVDLHSEPVKAMPWETAQLAAGSWTIGVKLLDIFGNESANAFIDQYTLGPNPGEIDAQAATLADWDGITGTGKPEDNATATEIANMVLNGRANRGSNLNWSTAEYRADEGVNGGPCFYKNAPSPTSPRSDEFIPVSEAEHYLLAASARVSASGMQVYLGVQCFDANKLAIDHWECWRDTAKNTTLFEAVTQGATTVKIVPAAEDWFVVTTPLSYIQWDIAPDFSDLPQQTATKITNIDKTTAGSGYWTLTLDTPAPASYPLGTPVGNSRSGSTATYALNSSPINTTDWVHFENTLTPCADKARSPLPTEIRAGTRYVRFIWWPGYQVGGEAWLDSVAMVPVSSWEAQPWTSGISLADAINNVHGISDGADVTDYAFLAADAQAKADAAAEAARVLAETNAAAYADGEITAAEAAAIAAAAADATAKANAAQAAAEAVAAADATAKANAAQAAAESAAAIDAQNRADAAQAVAQAFTESWSANGATVGADWDINLTNRPPDADILNAQLRHDADITVTVGSGGDYAGVNAAIAALTERFPSAPPGGITAEVNMLAGYVLDEQIFARNVNLSWIRITGVDASTNVDPTAFTIEHPLIGGSCHTVVAFDSGVAPVIAQTLNINTHDFATLGFKVGGALAYGGGSKVIIADTFGFSGYITASMLNATDSGEIYAPRAVLSTSLPTSFPDLTAAGVIRSQKNSWVDLTEATINSNGVTVSGGSFLNMNGATFQGVKTLSITQSSTVSAEAISMSITGASGATAVISKSSSLDVDDASISYSGGSFNITAQTGSRVSMTSVNLGAGTATVTGGSIIHAASSTGTLSQTANSVTANGLIFK